VALGSVFSGGDSGISQTQAGTLYAPIGLGYRVAGNQLLPVQPRYSVPLSLLPYLIADWDPNVHAYDSTTPAASAQTTSQGASVASLFDASGQNNLPIQGTGGNQPTLQTGTNGINGRACLAFASNEVLVASGMRTQMASGFTVVAAVTYVSESGVRVLAGGTTSMYIGQTATTGYLYTQVGSQEVVAALPFNQSVNVVRSTLDVTNSQVRQSVNQFVTTSTLTGTVPATGDWTIGNLDAGGFPFPGLVGRILIFNTALTEEEALSVEQGLALDYGIPLQPAIILYGDSFIANFGTTDTSFGIASQIQNFLGGSAAQGQGAYTLYTPALGESGHTTYDLATTYLSSITPWLSTNRPFNLVIIGGEATNSLTGTQGTAGAENYNETAPEAYADMVTLVTNIKNACLGAKVLIPTVIARNTSADSPNPAGTFMARALAYNALIKAGGPWDAVYDVASLNAFAFAASPGGPANTQYYNADQIHPGNQGAAIYAQSAASAVLPFLSVGA